MKNVKLASCIKNDKVGKYYLIDSDKFINQDFNGFTRVEIYEKLVSIGAINERCTYKMGLDNFLEYVNRILDGYLYIGRFKVYRVSNFTQSLDQQMKEERMRFIKED